jgi:TrwC relaxase
VTGVTTNVTLHAGHDVAYFTRGQDAGGCAGAMSYYTAAGEPPGQSAGTAARKTLGLTGQVDAGVLDRLFMKGIGPDGEILAAKRQRKDAAEREEAAVAAYRAAHPYASAVEIAEVRAASGQRRSSSAARLIPDIGTSVDYKLTGTLAVARALAEAGQTWEPRWESHG